MSDFNVSARIVSSDGSTLLAELSDDAQGLGVVSVQEPDETSREVRTTAPRVEGSSVVASIDDDGFLVLILEVEGASWGQVEARWQAVRAAYRAEPMFYLETEIEGVTKLWRTERPDVSTAGTESANLMQKRQTYSIRFRVQPNPSVTVA